MGAELIARGQVGDAGDKEIEYIAQPIRSHSPAQNIPRAQISSFPPRDATGEVSWRSQRLSKL